MSTTDPRDPLGLAADVSGRVRQSKAVQSQVLQRRWPVAVAAGVLIAGSVLIRRRRRAKA